MEVKAEITFKITELPQAVPTKDNKVRLELVSNGTYFTVLLSAKSYRKAEAAAAGFPYWAGAISGKLGKKTNKGFEVIEAGIQIFEKKPKEQLVDTLSLT